MPRSHLNSDVVDEKNWDYKLVRTHKETGQQQYIGFTHGILYKMDVTDSEWKELND